MSDREHLIAKEELMADIGKVLAFPFKVVFAPFMWGLMVAMVLVECALDPGRTPEVNRRELSDKMREYWRGHR